jgi:hypothetical protein
VRVRQRGERIACSLAQLAQRPRTQTLWRLASLRGRSSAVVIFLATEDDPERCLGTGLANLDDKGRLSNAYGLFDSLPEALGKSRGGAWSVELRLVDPEDAESAAALDFVPYIKPLYAHLLLHQSDRTAPESHLSSAAGGAVMISFVPPSITKVGSAVTSREPQQQGGLPSFPCCGPLELAGFASHHLLCRLCPQRVARAEGCLHHRLTLASGSPPPLLPRATARWSCRCGCRSAVPGSPACTSAGTRRRGCSRRQRQQAARRQAGASQPPASSLPAAAAPPGLCARRWQPSS